MAECIGQIFMLNGEAKHLSEWDDRILQESSVIYEVIRAADGIPLFFDDYYLRLKNSFSLVHQQFTYNDNYVLNIINKLLELNRYTDGPVKLLIKYDDPSWFLAYLMHPYVPTAEQYNSGIHTILCNKERLNPNAKVWNQQMRKYIVNELEKSGAFEVILVNEEGFITEGSRSNIFFVKNGAVYTPPDDQILPGITRKKVIQICESLGIEVFQQKIHTNAIANYEAVFVTGTSRKVVPVRSIGKNSYSVENLTMSKIIDGFENLVQEYLEQAKKKANHST